jgi:hypothetical protein
MEQRVTVSVAVHLKPSDLHPNRTKMMRLLQQHASQRIESEMPLITLKGDPNTHGVLVAVENIQPTMPRVQYVEDGSAVTFVRAVAKGFFLTCGQEYSMTVEAVDAESAALSQPGPIVGSIGPVLCCVSPIHQPPTVGAKCTVKTGDVVSVRVLGFTVANWMNDRPLANVTMLGVC